MDIHIKKAELGYLLHTVYTGLLLWNKDQNKKAKTLFLEENKHLCDLQKPENFLKHKNLGIKS